MSQIHFAKLLLRPTVGIQPISQLQKRALVHIIHPQAGSPVVGEFIGKHFFLVHGGPVPSLDLNAQTLYHENTFPRTRGQQMFPQYTAHTHIVPRNHR